MHNRTARLYLIVLLGAAVLLIGLLSAGCDVTSPNADIEQPQVPIAKATQSPVSSPTAIPADTPIATQISESAPDPAEISKPTVLPTPDLPMPTEIPLSTPTPFPTVVQRNSMVVPDSDYERAMRAARLSTSGWDTDFRLHTVPYSEIRFVIPRDNIPSIDSPKFVTPSDASKWLKDVEPVVYLEIEGDARAYPLQILTWHEIVNDVVGDTPVAVTFCPLCNSAIAFDRRIDGKELEFGVSGNLRNSDLIMYDRKTHSWWQQFTGEGIVGEYAGRSLENLPAFIISFADFKEAHRNGKVLSRDTGYARQYGRNPYAGYDAAESNPFLFTGDLDGRLLPVERVIAVSIDELDVAFPLIKLQEESVINYTVGEQDIVLLHKFGTTSALDASSIAGSRDVGAAAVFHANLDGQYLTFSLQNDNFVDDQTGSTWNILGSAVDGPLAGARLTPVVHGNYFWFAWAVFKPETLVYPGKDGV